MLPKKYSKILIVEDNDNLGDTLVEYLQDIGHQAVLAKNIKEGRKYFNDLNPNIILMDIGLPDGSGLDLAKELRAIRKDFVLLFLSALNDPDTKVQGFEAGADDYITKPFALKELLLRLNKIQTSQDFTDAAPEIVKFGNLIIWFKKYEVQDGNGNILPLSQKENAILEILYRNIENVCDRDKIIENVWGENKYPSNRTVDNYIVRLRKWTETDPSSSLQILSIRGIGYKLTTQNNKE
ncbi:MAG: response regulator transcription factor [Bacteriovoracaceae bacterium]|jgi:two-component system, OmpR family, alkaline phosphatase synthesis response regulator PhoP|nr:response regulator transcription factor [Bacteriovoracaceae bacterium]